MAAVEHAEFTDHFAGTDDPERHLPAIRGAHRDAQLTGDDQVNVISRITALKHHSAGFELAPVQQWSYRDDIGQGESAEQREGQAVERISVEHGDHGAPFPGARGSGKDGPGGGMNLGHIRHDGYEFARLPRNA